MERVEAEAEAGVRGWKLAEMEANLWEWEWAEMEVEVEGEAQA